MLPKALTRLNMARLGLYGPIDTSSPPLGMNHFSLMNCHFLGTVDLGNLPRALVYFLMQGNAIQSVQNVRNLPETICTLNFNDQSVEMDSVHIEKRLSDFQFLIDLRQCFIANVTFHSPGDFKHVLADGLKQTGRVG